jgi:hypothetical protein
LEGWKDGKGVQTKGTKLNAKGAKINENMLFEENFAVIARNRKRKVGRVENLKMW